jgi:tetratricopeptide (TPR) repeat protein
MQVSWVALVAATLLVGPGCSKASKIAGHIQRGGDYVAKGDFLKAEIEYLNAFRLDPANVPVARQLGEIYFQQGNIQLSFGFFKRAADAGNIDEDLHIKLGRIYLTGRDFTNALDQANAVLQSKPDSDEALILFSQASVTSNSLHEAALKLEALRPRAERTAGFHLAIGTIALRQKNLSVAEESFKRAVALAPKLSAAHEMLANLQLLQNNIAGGGQSLKTAAELAPIRSVTPLRYVDFLRDTGDEAGAMKMIEGLVAKVPDYIPANVQLAQMLFATKRNDECAEVLKRILAMDQINYEAMVLNGRLMLIKGDPAKGLAYGNVPPSTVAGRFSCCPGRPRR